MTDSGRQLSRGAGGFALASLLALAWSCSSPTTPTPPAVDPPTISCPASVTVQTLTGGATAVNFDPPTVVGGAAPLSVSCTHQNGAVFNVGTTQVSCTVRDAQQRSASCGFSVTVVVPPRITATRFLAFGDSITVGATPVCGPRVPHFTLEWLRTDALLTTAHVVDQPYPSRLQSLLAARYVAQSPVVLNSGVSGEGVVSGPGTPGSVRLPSTLSGLAPEVLLLQEGVNDLHAGVSPAGVVNGLRGMVQEGRRRGLPVFLGTLLPEHKNTCRGFAPELIEPTNALIRSMAPREGATLVDLYMAVGGAGTALIGDDGLHPTQAGYDAIANAFFQAIRGRLETP